MVVGTAAGEVGDGVASWAVAGAATSQIAASNAPHVVLASSRVIIFRTSFIPPDEEALAGVELTIPLLRLQQEHATPVLRPRTTAL